MKHFVMWKAVPITAAVLVAGSAMYAQTPAPAPITEATALKNSYNGIKANLTKAAERMPEDQYGFKASPDIRTFGALVGHIADTQARFCTIAAGGTPAPGDGAEKTKTSKADLVAALKASFDACDAAWDSMNDTSAAEMIAGRGGRQTSKLGTLAFITIVHNNEEYGYLAMYMRMKGMVPPSSDRGPM